MGLLLPRRCPHCGSKADYVWSVANIGRLIADVLFALVLYDILLLWFRCRQCGRQFKSD